MARTVSRTKKTNPYESTAITEVRVEGWEPNWLVVCRLKGLGRPVEEHGELELGCWAGEDRRLIAITEF
jgi:hypothetical protein